VFRQLVRCKSKGLLIRSNKAGARAWHGSKECHPGPASEQGRLGLGGWQIGTANALADQNHSSSLDVPPSLAAVIFPPEMADWVCKLYELAEMNLRRSDLEPREREAQTLLYASLLKKHGLVEPADRKRSENAQNQYSAKPKEGQSHGDTHPKTIQKRNER
jgi:hypothetical protein